MNNDIQEDYCSFEVSKLLKEKGFTIKCDSWYDKEGNSNAEELLGLILDKPTHSLAIKWIRENFGIHIYTAAVTNQYYYKIQIISALGNSEQKIKGYSGFCNTSEEATEAALLYTLQNLIK